MFNKFFFKNFKISLINFTTNYNKFNSPIINLFINVFKSKKNFNN